MRASGGRASGRPGDGDPVEGGGSDEASGGGRRAIGELERVAREPPPGWPPPFGGSRDDRRALLVLASLRGLTPRRLRELAWRQGSARACLAAVRAGRAGSDADRRHALEADSDELARAVAACGARLVTPRCEEYPPCLLDLADPPAALFVRGRSLTDRARRVAVVGARNCTPTGREAARELGRGLGATGLCVVSGAARGVDAAAHRGALDAGGLTLAVLGCGIDRAYPPASRTLLARIADEGTVASEYAPGVPAEAFRFPARNRIVAALVEALVVVEGAEGSGSLISTDHALDLGRQVFAVPGSVTNPLAFVPLALIREGAGMVRGPDDVLEDLGVAPGDGPGDADEGPDHRPSGLDPLEEQVLGLVGDAVLPEAVASAAGRPLPEVLSALTRLELRGLVRSVGGRVERPLRTGR